MGNPPNSSDVLARYGEACKGPWRGRVHAPFRLDLCRRCRNGLPAGDVGLNRRWECIVAEPNVLIEGIVQGQCPRWHKKRLGFSDRRRGRRSPSTWPGGMRSSTGWTPVTSGLTGSPTAGSWLSPTRRCTEREREGVLEPWVVVGPHGVTGRNRIACRRLQQHLCQHDPLRFHGRRLQAGHAAQVCTDGAVTRIADDLAFPHGTAATPDNTTLFIGESSSTALSAFDVAKDDTLLN